MWNYPTCLTAQPTYSLWSMWSFICVQIHKCDKCFPSHKAAETHHISALYIKTKNMQGILGYQAAPNSQKSPPKVSSKNKRSHFRLFDQMRASPGFRAKRLRLIGYKPSCALIGRTGGDQGRSICRWRTVWWRRPWKTEQRLRHGLTGRLVSWEKGAVDAVTWRRGCMRGRTCGEQQQWDSYTDCSFNVRVLYYQVKARNWSTQKSRARPLFFHWTGTKESPLINKLHSEGEESKQTNPPLDDNWMITVEVSSNMSKWFLNLNRIISFLESLLFLCRLNVSIWNVCFSPRKQRRASTPGRPAETHRHASLTSTPQTGAEHLELQRLQVNHVQGGMWGMNHQELLTSMMTVASALSLEHMVFSCLQGPIRNVVLQSQEVLPDLSNVSLWHHMKKN